MPKGCAKGNKNASLDEQIKNRVFVTYITTDRSLAQLSEQFKIPKTTLVKWSRDGGWVKMRTEYADNLKAYAMDTIIARDRTDMATCIANSLRIQERINEVLEDRSQLHRYVGQFMQKDEDGSVISKMQEYEFGKTNITELRDLADANSKNTATLARLLGIPTQAEQKAQDIAERKMRLEEQKAKDESSDNGITVTFNASVEGVDA